MLSRALLCSWPGLRSSWEHGSWSGLATSLLFAVLLNFSLVVTFVWFETISPEARLGLWSALGAAWIGCSILAWRARAPETPEDKMIATVDLFRRAQGEYLQGNWVEAELQLLRLLEEHHEDCDARLLLATLYRHTRRYDEARRELAHLEQLDTAVKWRWEIAREQEELRESPDNGTEQANHETTEADEQPATVPFARPDIEQAA